MPSSRRTLTSFLVASALGCGAQQPAPSAPEESVAEAPRTAPPPEAVPVSPAPEGTSGDTAGPATPLPAPEPDAAPTEPAEPSARDVQYIVSPEGLRVKVAGAAFTPKAEAVKVAGGWGIKVQVEAKADEDTSHSLLAPKAAEIAFAGRIRRAGGSEPESFSDSRDGDRELTVTPGKPVKLQRAWPAKDGPKPLGPGDELEIQVGLWGLGADAASRRPVNKLCRIEVKFDKEKPRVKVTAPAGVSK